MKAKLMAEKDLKNTKNDDNIEIQEHDESKEVDQQKMQINQMEFQE
jgi:hypothetical protein